MVRQQLESFDEFITMSVQRIVEESPAIELQSENQYTTNSSDEPTKYHIKFDQIYLSKVNQFYFEDYFKSFDLFYQNNFYI